MDQAPVVLVTKAFAFELYMIRIIDGHARLLDGSIVQDNSLIWLQGVVADASEDGSVILDDGTGVLRCVLKSGSLDVFRRGGGMDTVRPGVYAAVKGDLVLASLPEPGKLGSLELRNCGAVLIDDPNMEVLWMIERVKG